MHTILGFIKETLVNTPQGPQPNNILQEGSELFSYSIEENKCYPSLIYKVYSIYTSAFVELITDSFSIKGALDQLVYVNNHFVSMYNCKEGDALFVIDSAPCIIKKIKMWYVCAPVYSFAMQNRAQTYVIKNVIASVKL